MSTLKLPFTLERTSSTSPVTTAGDVDISAIEGLESSTVQAALEELNSKTPELPDNLPNDEDVVHNTGDEDIEGDKTFVDNVEINGSLTVNDGLDADTATIGGALNVGGNIKADGYIYSADKTVATVDMIPNPYTKAEVDAKIAAIQPGMSDAEKAQFQSNTQDIAENKVKIAANSALIASLQQNGLPTGSDYSFTFVEEAVMEGLTAENTTAAVLYFGLEEDVTEVSHATYDKGYCSTNVTYSNGYAAVGGSYDKGFVSI